MTIAQSTMVKNIKQLTRGGFVLLFSLFTIVSSGWVGDGLKGECLFQWLGECGNNFSEIICRIIPAFVVFLLSAIATYFLAKEWFPIRHLAENQAVRPHRVLIAPISLFNPLPESCGDKCEVKDPRSQNKVSLTGNLADDIEEFNKLGWRWNGQQFLRGLEPHVTSDTLTDLVLIGSSGKFASHAGLGVTKQMVKLYSKANVHLHPEAIDFEDIQTLQQVFDGWIKTFLEKKVSERDILLDATGGQKTTSIAAALTTLRWKQVEFQYVESKDSAVVGEKPNVISFNVVVEAPQKGVES